MGTLNVALEHGIVAPCAAVAMVTKDNAINVWPYGGAVAQRFSHGFAGPDITLGSGALAKLANACDSQIDFVAGDETIKWGVVFDLAVAASQTPGFRPTSTVVLAKPAVPGRKNQRVTGATISWASLAAAGGGTPSSAATDRT